MALVWRRLIVPGCIAAVLIAARVQHIVLGMEPEIRGFVIPAIVGGVFGVLLVRILRLRDLQQQNQSKIAALNSELRALVAERTSELREAEAHLLQAQKMEAIGRLAGGVAHDFNNLLTVVIGGTSMALRSCGGEAETRNLLNQVLEAANRGAALTRQLLAFGRPQSASPEILRLETAVDDLVPMLRMALGGQVRIEWKAGENVPPVYIDKGQLGQVLMNLVVNARDAMPNGGAIELTTRGVVRDGQERAELFVRDGGIGMDPETREKVLEPFFSTKPIGRGSGLGLSVAFGIVKNAGGELRITSEKGVGTEVVVDLPGARGRSQRDLKEGVVEDVPAMAHGTVLVIDDDESVILMVGRGLVSGGYKVLSARDAASADKCLRDHGQGVDLILCDVALAKGECGVEVARKALELSPSSALIFMSGYAEDVTSDAALTKEPLLQKPFSVEELLARTGRALGSEAAQPVGRRSAAPSA